MAPRRRSAQLGRDSDSENIAIVGSADGYQIGPRGKRFIDFTAGWCVGNFGWNSRGIRAALRDFRGPAYVFPEYRYADWDELAALLGDLAPSNLRRCFRATGGSEAVDLALQAAMVHTGRRKFISIEDAYHGNTIGALSVGSGDRDTLRNLMSNCHRIKPPLTRRSADGLETLLKRRDVAAIIMEPISMNLGVMVPEAAFFTRVAALCARYGTLFIADEVATGFGRTGKLFAVEHFNLKPDIMCLAKAITGGHGAMGAMMTNAAVGRSMQERGHFYSTYGWHPMSVAAALATLRPLRRGRRRFLTHVNALSALFATQLAAIRFQQKPQIRIRGLAIALDFASQREASRIVKRAAELGLLLTSQDKTILLLPPLTISKSLAAEGLSMLRTCA